MHIALLAGEASGDQLGAELIRAIKRINSDIYFDGVGGPLMQAEGFNSLLPMDDFSVMGITEIIKRLPKLLRHKKKLIKNYQKNVPDVFIGIDYPEFNLSLEKYFKNNGVFTAHYVSPSVWAWRQERIHRIKDSCDLMLTLFAFEKNFYDEHHMPAVWCGHPLLDMIPEPINKEQARAALALSDGINYLAVLPGSRESEVKKMLPIFIEVMIHLANRLPDLCYLIPAANPALSAQIENILKQQAPDINATVILGQGRTVMAASEAVLLASGTAALEAMLLEKPMLVSYKVSGLTAVLAKRMLQTEYFSLPNLLASQSVVPEFIQDDIDPDKMAHVLFQLVSPSPSRYKMIEGLQVLRQQLKPNAADNAARALFQKMAEEKLLDDKSDYNAS